MDSIDTLTLTRRLAAGDRTALEPLLCRHLPGLRAYVRLLQSPALRAREETVDLVQSVCREVLERAEGFQHASEAAFRQWLYRTAERKVQKRYRHWAAQRREAAREAVVDADGVLDAYRTFCTPSEIVASREAVARIEAAFDRLSPQHREVILLARVVGLSHAEIAARTGRGEGAVRMQLSRALARLAEILYRGQTEPPSS